MSDIDYTKLNHDRKLHYKLVKKYFRKSASLKKGYYTDKDTEKLKKDLQKRDMWKIYSSTIDEILKINPKIKSVIDVGCGMGNFTLELVFREHFDNIFGIDFLKETLVLACENKILFENVSFIEGNLLNFPFLDRCFDLTICINLLHHIHISDINRAIMELVRITDKYIILEIKNEKNIFNFWNNRVTLPIFYKDLPIYNTSVKYLNKIMDNHEFELIKIKRKILSNWICNRLVLVYKRINLGDII